MPARRPLFLEFPDDPKCYTDKNLTFMFGKSILVANVVEKGATTRTIWVKFNKPAKKDFTVTISTEKFDLIGMAEDETATSNLLLIKRPRPVGKLPQASAFILLFSFPGRGAGRTRVRTERFYSSRLSTRRTMNMQYSMARPQAKGLERQMPT